ncbi:MAG: hypothetical protein VYC09_07825 [Verrucomicrobiota bacterium]|jgi:hypothetical protein|nr:hypothetical protein [Verrucomicrobiota bacterium]
MIRLLSILTLSFSSLSHAGERQLYVEARGNHIRAWLNGVSTIDVVHEGGRLNGKIGFELCNGPKQTKIEVRQLLVKVYE